MNTGGGRGTGHVQGKCAALAALFVTLGCGLVLAWSTVPSAWWGPAQTALLLVGCGLSQAELARRHTARAGPIAGVSTVGVWVVGGVLILPLAAVQVVAAMLHAHDLLRGPPRDRHTGRVLAGIAGAALAWLVASATTSVLAAVLAGLTYLVVTDGPTLLAGVRRRRPSGDPVSSAALGVLLGLCAQFTPFAAVFVLLPAAYLQRSARGRALRHAATHDPKTGLWNHAAWQTLSSAALAGPRARARSAVLMVDLDHFKRLNDSYGHHAGDDVLTGVATVLQTMTRRGDVVARFGGEEFSILLPGVTGPEACVVAERIRDRIAALTVVTTDLRGRPVTISGVTASIGIATTGQAAPNVEALLVNADRLLYQAKERGRNRVCGPALAAAA